MKTYQIKVFGKVGCQKCKVLNQRLDALLAEERWQEFEKAYFDVETEEGLVHFCTVECINPNRIPALAVARRDESTGSYHLISNPNPGEADSVCKNSRLYTFVGLQTDYTAGGGVITPKMLTSVLEAAMAAG